MSYWGGIKGKTFDAFVDTSKALKHFGFLIDEIKRINVNKTIGTDRRTLQLPLKLDQVHHVNSKDNEVVQIADVVAGAVNHYYRGLANPDFEDTLSKAIGGSKMLDYSCNLVWPHDSITPEQLGTDFNPGKSLLDSLTDLRLDADSD